MLSLNVLVGPPVGINIRNLVWHGFVLQEEVDRAYVYMLFVLTCNVMRLLKEKAFEVEYRPLYRLDMDIDGYDFGEGGLLFRNKGIFYIGLIGRGV